MYGLSWCCRRSGEGGRKEGMKPPRAAHAHAQASDKPLSHDDIQNNKKNTLVMRRKKKEKKTHMAYTLFPSAPIARLLNRRAARLGSCQTCALNSSRTKYCCSTHGYFRKQLPQWSRLSVMCHIFILYLNRTGNRYSYSLMIVSHDRRMTCLSNS